MKGFEQALAVKQVSQNIKSFWYLNLLYPPNQLDRNFWSFLGASFWDVWDLSDSEQQLEDGSWSVSAFLLQKSFSDRSVPIFSSRLFLVIYTLDRNKTRQQASI